MEEAAIRNMEFQQLHKALLLLSEYERVLMEQLYFERRTERKIADERGIYHNAIHKQKNRILDKLKKTFREILILGYARCSANVEVSEGENSSSYCPLTDTASTAVISSSTDPLAVLPERDKRHGGHAKTTCRQLDCLSKR